MRHAPCRSALVALAIAALAAGAQAAAQEQDPPQQSTTEQGLPPGQFPAVLKSREAQFIYRSSANMLACDELRNHISVILRAVGARDDVQVTARDCDLFIAPDSRFPGTSDPTVSGTFDRDGTFDRGTVYDPTRSSMDRTMPGHLGSSRSYRGQSTPVHIRVMMPVVATPDIMAEVDRDKSRRELISRVTGNPAAAMNDAIFFRAERREVKLSHATIGLESIDCELLEQMVPSVFRDLDLKVTGPPPSCDPNEGSHFVPRLTVEALLPVGVLMPGEQKERKRAEEAAQRKASQPPGQ